MHLEDGTIVFLEATWQTPRLFGLIGGLRLACWRFADQKVICSGSLTESRMIKHLMGVHGSQFFAASLHVHIAAQKIGIDTW